MTVSVDVSFDTSREGLDFHDFFEQHCAGRVRVFMFDEEDAILSLADYHNGCSQPRSMQAYCVCEAWLCHKGLSDHGYRVEFDSASDAMLFKLTFKGV
jgi:hypothetical protein